VIKKIVILGDPSTGKTTLCDDIPYGDTWERSGDANHHKFQAFSRQYLKEHGIKHILASGDIAQRKMSMDWYKYPLLRFSIFNLHHNKLLLAFSFYYTTVLI